MSREKFTSMHGTDQFVPQLAIATLATTITGAVLATGGKKAEDLSQPPINAKSKDEESFVKYVCAWVVAARRVPTVTAMYGAFKLGN